MNVLKLLLCALLIIISGHLFAQSSASLKKKKQAINNEIAELKRTRSKIDKSKKLSLAQINLLDAQINLREEKIETINSEIRLLSNKIYDNTTEVKSLQSQLSKLKLEYAKMVQFAYRNQGSYNKLMFIFASSNFNQAYKRLKYLQQFSDSRRRKAVYIENTKEDLTHKISELDKNKKEKSGLLEDEIHEKQNLGEDKEDQSKVLSSLNVQEQKLQQQLESKQKQAKALNNAIQAAIRKEILAEQKRAIEAARRVAAKAKAAELARRRAEEIKRANESAADKRVVAKPERSTPEPREEVKPIAKGSAILSSNPVTAKLSSDFLSNRGSLPKPVQGIITQSFGSHTYKNVTVNNTGINIKTADGASVYSIFNGQVVNVVYLINSYTVIIRHGEYFSIYSKLRNATVSAGEKVSTRQLIGTVATDHSEDTTELQFQIWKGANPVNPSSWITR
ncbi:MAG: Septal ring factor EnvC, activator of murein hydrolase AmiA and AmiB [Sphingobacteriales bacterium]|nr:Septal ring factor EnvC, activator of murein hydrolase AmiA and AmiB [Sphingobacteriales bacterium]